MLTGKMLLGLGIQKDWVVSVFSDSESANMLRGAILLDFNGILPRSPIDWFFGSFWDFPAVLHRSLGTLGLSWNHGLLVFELLLIH